MQARRSGSCTRGRRVQNAHTHGGCPSSSSGTAEFLRSVAASAQHSQEVKRYANTQSADTSLSMKGPTSSSVHACGSRGRPAMRGWNESDVSAHPSLVSPALSSTPPGWPPPPPPNTHTPHTAPHLRGRRVGQQLVRRQLVLLLHGAHEDLLQAGGHHRHRRDQHAAQADVQLQVLHCTAQGRDWIGGEAAGMLCSAHGVQERRAAASLALQAEVKRSSSLHIDRLQPANHRKTCGAAARS